MKIYSVSMKGYFTSSDGCEYQMADGLILPKLFKKHEDAMAFYKERINDYLELWDYNIVREQAQIRTIHGQVLHLTELVLEVAHRRCIIYLSIQDV